MNEPHINVTPLIDVLLVLLIVFMLVAPLKPSAFRTRVPSDAVTNGKVNPDSLIVNLNPDLSIDLNNEANIANVSDTARLIDRLKGIFEQRYVNGNASDSFANSTDRPTFDPIERTVFIKAPRSIDYGSVAHLVDAVKRSGAFPIALQLDHLN